jgi:hypothetical protein
LAAVGRNPTPLDCLAAIVSPQLWAGLVNATNSWHLSQKASGNFGLQMMRLPLLSVFELKRIFFARLKLIAAGTNSIDEFFAVRSNINIIICL